MIYSYKKADGKTWYYLKYYKDGKTYTKRGFKTRNEALNYYSTFTQEIDSKTDVSYKTFEQVYEMWLEIYKDRVKESTLVKTTTAFRLHILPYFGDKKVKDINSYMVQEYALKLRDFTSGKEIFNKASNIMKYAINLGIIQQNPFEYVELPKFKKYKKHETYLEVEDINKLLNVIDDYSNYCAFRLLIYTGLRRGELLALEWNDVDFKNKTVNVNKTLTYGKGYKTIVNSTKTQNSIRTVDIDDETLKHLKNLKLQTQSKLVFPNSKDGYQRLSNLQDRLNKYCKKANINKIRVHDLRHTHASLLFASGSTAKEVQERLGHTDIKTTLNIYTHLTKKQKKLSLDKFINYMEGQA